MKQTFLAAVSGLLCLALTGCSTTGDLLLGNDAEELMRAPRFSGEYSLVEDALDAYLGETPQLKYPAGGSYQSPFLFGDFDGNGTEDAAVLYTSSAKGQNVQLAVLQQHENTWAVVQEIEGLSSGVDSVATATLDPSGHGVQLIVGYASPQGDKYLAVYNYSERTLSTVLETDYEEFLAADITGSGGQDIAIVKQAGDTIELQLLTGEDNEFRVVQNMTVSEGRFTACADLQAGVGRDGKPTLTIDGYTGSGGTNLASELFVYDTESRMLRAVDSTSTGEDIYALSLRNLAFLLSCDIDDNGSVEIPLQFTGTAAGEVSPALEMRTFFVGWADYSRSAVPRCFGVVDAEYGFFLQLPLSWMGEVSVTSGLNENYWEVRSLDKTTLYLTLRIADAGVNASGDYQRAALLGRQQIQLRVTDAARQLGFESLKGCITVF